MLLKCISMAYRLLILIFYGYHTFQGIATEAGNERQEATTFGFGQSMIVF